VSRSWAEFLGDPAPESEPESGGRGGWFRRLRESLATSREALTSELASVVFDPADDESWERIEEALLRADVGVPATVEIVRRLEERRPATQAELVEGLVWRVPGVVSVDLSDVEWAPRGAARPAVR